MEDKKEAIEQNTEETKPAAENVVDDDIQYTFVVPRGEIFREPDIDEDPAENPEDNTEEPEKQPACAPSQTIVADRKSFTESVNAALAAAAEADGNDRFNSEDHFFDTYLAADPKGRTTFIDPPVYAATGLPDDDDITYTFVVPKGEVYKEPDPEEEQEANEAAHAERASEEAMQTDDEADDVNKTRYGLPVDHPETGELAQKQEERRLYKQRKRNRFRTRFYVITTSIILIVCWLIISNTSLFTIDSIVVQGNSHYTAEEIINMGHASPGRNIIYKANIKQTKEYLENNPYIKSAEVKRRLPSTLVIKVTERQERLAFKYDDDYLVMDEDGILLKKTRNTPKTTIIQGAVVSKIKLGEKVGTENSKSMDQALEFISMMMKSDLYFVKADLSKEKEVKAYVYDTLVVKTDYDTLLANMENGRLHLVLEKLFEDGIERGTITFLEDGSTSFMPIF